MQPVLLTSYSGGFILLYIQYHKLTLILELVFFSPSFEVNFEWYHVTLSQGGTVQVKNHTWMFFKGSIHAQQWCPQEVHLLESQPC